MLIDLKFLIYKYNVEIKGILHIGAHLCEEKILYNENNVSDNRIIWIEANPILVNKIKSMNNKIKIECFCCIDDDIGYSTLNIANNGMSSSILKLGIHKKFYPNIDYIGNIQVNNKRIDTFYKENNISVDFANFLCIDIQGTELLALKGMGDLLKYFDYLYLEVNQDYLYEKCALIGEIDNYLNTFSFKRVETKWENDCKWGDAFYIKNF